MVAGDATYDFYYNNDWQLLEVRKDSDTDPLKQYVWGQRYIDAPVCRFRDDDTDGNDIETVYYTNDANMNVTALIDTDGAVLERYLYDPYGKVTVLNANWTDDEDGVSDYENSILFCGYYRDSETGLYHVRNRYLHPTLGRWTQPDHIGQYIDGGNLFEYVGSSPLCALDPMGHLKRAVIGKPSIDGKASVKMTGSWGDVFYSLFVNGKLKWTVLASGHEVMGTFDYNWIHPKAAEGALNKGEVTLFVCGLQGVEKLKKAYTPRIEKYVDNDTKWSYGLVEGMGLHNVYSEARGSFVRYDTGIMNRGDKLRWNNRSSVWTTGINIRAGWGTFLAADYGFGVLYDAKSILGSDKNLRVKSPWEKRSLGSSIGSYDPRSNTPPAKKWEFVTAAAYYYASPLDKWFYSYNDVDRAGRRYLLGKRGILTITSILGTNDPKGLGFGIPRDLEFMLPGVPEK